tara:strand:- start:3428 stop:4588 length:1161 start_codon:yes stop_codon:yes gene_type:complete
LLDKKKSIYIHWPFCLSKCPYCDFNSHVCKKDLEIDAWKKAYMYEIQKDLENTKTKNIHSIFFGGGTPSLMPISVVDFILNILSKNYSISNNCEITLEANPSSAERSTFKNLSEIGINRLSLGLQSLNDKHLLLLGRNHNSKEGLLALENAKKYYKKISFDLIYGLPDQTEKNWESELSKAINISHGHLSAYQLTIEKGTPFYTMHRDKKLILPSEETLLNLYKLTDDLLISNNFKKYEVSNYAIAGQESFHNIKIWEGLEYCGFGPGAHGRIKINNSWFENQRFSAPFLWLNKAVNKENTLLVNKSISPDQRAKEILLTSLRLTKGANLILIKDLCNLASLQNVLDKNSCKFLKKEKLLDIKNNIISITSKGFPLLNSIINKIIM